MLHRRHAFFPCQVLWVVALLCTVCPSLAAPPARWQIRGGHNGDSGNFSMLAPMARHGMNSIFVSMGGHMLHPDRPDRAREQTTLGPQQRALLDRWQQATAAEGLKFFPMIEVYGTDDRKRWPLQRVFVDRAGKAYPHTPCPNDPEFWQKNLINFFVEVARWAADKPNVPAILTDAEMYGADRSAFVDDCFCPDCRAAIAERLNVHLDALDLADGPMLARYRAASLAIVTELATRLREAVHAVYPHCLLGGYVLDHFGSGWSSPAFYRGVTLGWGTPELPVLVFSEATYETGYHAAFTEPDRPLLRATGSGDGATFGIGDHPGYLERVRATYRQWGAHARLVPGLWINRIPEENFAENIYHCAINTRGYWIYDLMPLGEKAMRREHGYLQLPGGGAAAYWQAIQQGNEELDRWLRSEGRHVSTLRLRAFTLPAPSVTLSSRLDVDLPVTGGLDGPAPFLFRNSEAHYYIPAAAGDEARVAVVVDSAHSSKKKRDAVAIVVIDPRGAVIERQKFTFDDLDAEAGADGRWHGRRDVSFRAEQAGAYCIMLRGARYAYGLGPSSHGWVASLRGPVRLFAPKRLHIKALAGADALTLDFGNAVDVEVLDEARNRLATTQAVIQPGLHRLTIDLAGGASRVLSVRFTRPPVSIAFKSQGGMLPWLAGAAAASFPVD